MAVPWGEVHGSCGDHQLTVSLWDPFQRDISCEGFLTLVCTLLYQNCWEHFQNPRLLGPTCSRDSDQVGLGYEVELRDTSKVWE